MCELLPGKRGCRDEFHQVGKVGRVSRSSSVGARLRSGRVVRPAYVLRAHLSVAGDTCGQPNLSLCDNSAAGQTGVAISAEHGDHDAGNVRERRVRSSAGFLRQVTCSAWARTSGSAPADVRTLGTTVPGHGGFEARRAPQSCRVGPARIYLPPRPPRLASRVLKSLSASSRHSVVSHVAVRIVPQAGGSCQADQRAREDEHRDGRARVIPGQQPCRDERRRSAGDHR